MAGLCGWFKFPGTDPDRSALLQRMVTCLPDHRQREDRVIEDEHAAAILADSQSAGMIVTDRLFGVVDGEPRWTERELAQRASADGFAASFDAAWRIHGQAALRKLTGAFAIAVHDRQLGQSCLAVDKMGRRQLAYATAADGRVVFATSATAVTPLPGVGDSIDPQSIYNYVYFHAVPSPRTIFSAVRKVRPGHCVLVQNGKASESRFWHPDYSSRPRRPPGPMLPVVRAAVERCRTTPATGCFLSGGLDSSTVAGVLNEQTDGPAKAFTIGFAQEGYDEIGYARIATKHFGLDLNEYYITAEDVADAFSEVARAYDEPFGNSSAVPALICARMAAAQGVTNLLAGDGGDELFAGNERYATQQLFGYYQHVPKWLRHSVLEPFFGRQSVVNRSSGLQHKVRRYIEQANVPMPERMQTYNMLHRTAPDTIFSPDFLDTIDPRDPIDEMAYAYADGDDATDLDRMLQLDWKFTLADNDLRKVTRMCDLAGVTVHFPLLDDELIDYSILVPSSVKIKRKELRHFFKQSTRDFLPAEIIAKSKHGFGLPFGEWLRQDDGLRDLVGGRVAALKQRGIFAPDFIDQLMAQHASDHAAYYGNIVWVLAMFEEWCSQHRISL